MGRPVQPRARSGHGERLPRRDAAERQHEGGALLLDVRPALLLHEDHAGRARLRGKRDEGEVGGVREEGRCPLSKELTRETSNPFGGAKRRPYFINSSSAADGTASRSSVRRMR